MTSPGETPTPRLVPEQPLPPYTFVPGQAPHPISDPAGHSYHVERPRPEPVSPERWHASPAYLYGLDLFNAQFFWEAHEQLEGLWLAAGRKGPAADFFKGLIKLAAAGVKQLEGKPAGVESHARRAAELFRRVARERSAADGQFLGLALGELIRLAEAVCAGGWPHPSPLILPALPKAEVPPPARE